MAQDPTTRALSDKHAEFIEKLFDAPTQRGSGNQWNRPTDNRMDPHNRHAPFAFAFEGKATQAASTTIKLSDWYKLREQAHGLRPAMAYRFYRKDNLLVPLADLIAVDAHDFAEILERANAREEAKD
jgi:hypothetical protein